MKFVLFTLVLIIITITIWVLLFPKSAIRAGDIRHIGKQLYQMVKTWTNNRLQTHRLRQSLVQREIMLAHSQQLPILSSNSEQHELAAKAFKRLIIFQKHKKTVIVIPTGTFAITKFSIDELDNYLLELLTMYYPDHHWQPTKPNKLSLFNYFYLEIKQK